MIPGESFVQGEEFNSMTLVGPFQLSLFSDFVTKSLLDSVRVVVLLWFFVVHCGSCGSLDQDCTVVTSLSMRSKGQYIFVGTHLVFS